MIHLQCFHPTDGAYLPRIVDWEWYEQLFRSCSCLFHHDREDPLLSALLKRVQIVNGALAMESVVFYQILQAYGVRYEEWLPLRLL